MPRRKGVGGGKDDLRAAGVELLQFCSTLTGTVLHDHLTRPNTLNLSLSDITPTLETFV